MTCERVTVSTHVTTSLHRSARVADRQTDIRESDQHKHKFWLSRQTPQITISFNNRKIRHSATLSTVQIYPVVGWGL